MLKYYLLAFLVVIAVTACQAAPNPSIADRAPIVITPPTPSTPAWVGQTGVASYYGRAHQGRRTASGPRFDQRALTAAHPYLPFGTRIRVTVPGTGRSVVVTINDRLLSRTRIIDLSLAAAQRLGMVRQGIARVKLAPA